MSMDIVRGLICPYPPNKKVDRILENLGEDFGYDDIHNVEGAEECEDDSEESDEEMKDFEEEDADGDGDGDEADAAVAGDSAPSFAMVAQPEVLTELSAEQADHLQMLRVSTSAIKMHLEAMKGSGLVTPVQALEMELKKSQRAERALLRTEPAVAESFFRLRKAEAEEFHQKQRIAAQMRAIHKEAAVAIAARDNAAAELNNLKRKCRELESERQCKHAVKTFSLVQLGDGNAKAGGVQGRKYRHDILDRLSRMRGYVGLSDEQKNDFSWWKDAWDEAMVKEHKEAWAKTFAGWMQGILASTNPNEFSLFMYSETVRVLGGQAVLAVPGGG